MPIRNTLAAFCCLTLFAPIAHAAPKPPSAQSQLDSLTQTIILRRDAALALLQSAKDAVVAAGLKLSPVKPSTLLHIQTLEKQILTDEAQLVELKAGGRLASHPAVQEATEKLNRERPEYDALVAARSAVVTDPAEILAVKAQRDAAMQQAAVAQALVDTLNALIKQQSNLTASVRTK